MLILTVPFYVFRNKEFLNLDVHSFYAFRLSVMSFLCAYVNFFFLGFFFQKQSRLFFNPSCVYWRVNFNQTEGGVWQKWNVRASAEADVTLI